VREYYALMTASAWNAHRFDSLFRSTAEGLLFVGAFHPALYFTQTRAWIALGESLLS
jgi:hypothetical protein